jgi:DNA repair exonuclease SbcCD nuclease subunit
MVRISHISDIHWRGIARHDEYTKAFENLFQKLKEEKPDIIINTGDSFHTKTQGITPEIIERLSWMFRNLAEIAPSYTILGNHDGNLNNGHRQDIITPIHMAINHPRAFLLKDSQVRHINKEADLKINQNVYLCVYSPFDKKSWDKVQPVKSNDNINIALFHGSISGSEMDNNWRLTEGEASIIKFKDYDFVLLGDIHKQQFVNYKTIEQEVDDEELQNLVKLYGKEAIEIIDQY